MLQPCGRLARDCLPASPSKSPPSTSADVPTDSLRVGARSNHERRRRHAASGRPNQVSPEDHGNAGDTCIPCREPTCGQPFQASCRRNEQTPCVDCVLLATSCPPFYFSMPFMKTGAAMDYALIMLIQPPHSGRPYAAIAFSALRGVVAWFPAASSLALALVSA